MLEEPNAKIRKNHEHYKEIIQIEGKINKLLFPKESEY